jgi:sialic acid synthase SpsE
MIIAEIGLNHLGDIKQARRYVNLLSHSSIDAITLQVREKEYYKEKPHLLLDDVDYINLKHLAQSHGKKLGIALADVSKIDYFESIGVDFYKIIRNDITNTVLTDKLISTNKKIIASTGLSSHSDIKKFLSRYPDNQNITLNHTQLSYDINDCNLSAIASLKENFNINVSYGSHCKNYNTLYMALCYKPSDILFYVKETNSKKYPDDKHAILIYNVPVLSKNLKELTIAIGDGVKGKFENKIDR